QVTSHFDDFVVGELFKVGGTTASLVNLLEVATQLLDLYALLVVEHVGDAIAQTFGGPTQVNFKHLTHVHTRRHAQRVKNDVGGGTVGHVRHVFNRGNARNNTLVTVTTGHLVTRLQTTLHSQVNLDHLEHARRQLVALRKLLALLFERQIELMTFLFERLFGLLEHHGIAFIGQTNIKPLPTIEIVEVFAG